MTKLSNSDISDYKFNNLTRVVLYVAFITIGFVLYAKSYIKLSTIVSALGITFIITGGVFAWMSGKEKKLYLSKYDLIFGVLAALCGLLMIINPGNIVSNLTFYYGLFMLVCGTQKLVVSTKLFKMKNNAALLTLVTAILIYILGILLIINPFGNMTYNELCGLFTIFYGVIQLANTVLLNNHEDEIIKKNK
ncbi:MAG: DUF308 domain-containing protein [Bacilli bacterium]|nr:DUF308 domain-containing protein [Bacilli bacterium]